MRTAAVSRTVAAWDHDAASTSPAASEAPATILDVVDVSPDGSTRQDMNDDDLVATTSPTVATTGLVLVDAEKEKLLQPQQQADDDVSIWGAAASSKTSPATGVDMLLVESEDITTATRQTNDSEPKGDNDVLIVQLDATDVAVSP